MARQTAVTDTQFNPYLSANQQDLLLAALTSNKADANSNSGTSNGKRPAGDSHQHSQYTAPALNNAMFTSPQQMAPMTGTLADLDYDDSPYLDYLDGDGSFEMDGADLNGQSMIGDYEQGDGFEKHDKRKSPEEGNDNEDGDAKRREGDEKGAKKPGRKPLTSEPTTKRKAQNRAAQRAFRDRKEKHLKDLETKVVELTKTSEADKQANELLKAQVDRLSSELKDYRKRMSMSAGLNRSPPTSISAGSGAASARSAKKPSNDFHFEFPKFGATPGSQLFPKAEQITPPLESTALSFSRPSSTGNGYSAPVKAVNPASQSPRTSSDMTSVKKASPESLQQSQGPGVPPMNGLDDFAGLFSPALLSGVGNGSDNSDYGLLFSGVGYGTENNDYGFSSVGAGYGSGQNGYGSSIAPVPAPLQDNGTDNNSGLSRVFRFNSGSTSSNNNSPSASSTSQYNANSSCGTSPEPSQHSPADGNSQQQFSATAVKAVNNGTSYLNTSIPKSLPQAPPSQSVNSIDWLATQNGGQFDPVLFGDYRDSQDAIIGDGEFNNGFFNEAFPFDMSSPMNFGDFASPRAAQQNQLQNHAQSQSQSHSQAPNSASRNLLAEVEKQREGGEDDDEHVGMYATQNKDLMNCNTIWNQLQNNQDFQDGKFDLDGLCSELRAKAKCSDSGVAVPTYMVDDAFKKLSNSEHTGMKAYPVFNQEAVNDAVKRLAGGAGSRTN